MPAKGHAGQLILEFYDEEQLNGLYERLIANTINVVYVRFAVFAVTQLRVARQVTTAPF